MNEMVERVARAMIEELRRQAEDNAGTVKGTDSDDVLIDGRGFDMKLVAKAGIAALREPTLAMRQAGAFRGRLIDLGNGKTAEGMALGDHPITSYTKMIDEALKE